MISHLIAVNIVEGPGATDVSTTLTPTDICNIWSYEIDGVSMRKRMRLYDAVIAGYCDLSENNTPRYASPWDKAKFRVQYTVDKENGNRIKQLVMDLD
jgi:hypothetical protein